MRQRLHCRNGLIAACALLLAGCQSNKMQSAWELIQQQQQEQALMRQADSSSDQEHRSNEPKLMLALIRESQAQERYFASLAYIDSYRQRFGDSDELAALQAEALRRTGQKEESEAVYRKLLGGSQAALGWHGLGLLAGARGEFAQAAEYLDRAVKLAPTDAPMLGDLGYARLRAGDMAGARVPLGKAAELDPTNTKVLANMALLLVVEGNAVQAQQLMDRAQLGLETRSQIYQLANQMRLEASMERTPAQAVTGRVRNLERSAGDREIAQVSGGRDVVMPMLQPVMERMINPPMVQ